MHSDISKKDHEHSNYFPVIMVLYHPYNREKEYKGLNRTVTPVIYLKLQTIRVITDKYGLGTSPTYACCEVCQQEEETTQHILSACPLASQLWQSLQMTPPPQNLPNIQNWVPPPSIPTDGS